MFNRVFGRRSGVMQISGARTHGAVCPAGVVCFGGAVFWESCKQLTTAVSTMDAKYQACGSVASEALSLRKLLCEFSVLCREMWPGEASVVLCDKKAAVSLCFFFRSQGNEACQASRYCASFCL
jgi:hypothetical protein